MTEKMPASGNNIVALIVRKTVIDLTDIGYDGMVVTMRLNPRAADYDKMTSSDDKVSWEGLGAILLSWNIGDEDGNPLPLPKDGTKREDLPIDILAYIYRKYYDAFKTHIEKDIPKVVASS